MTRLHRRRARRRPSAQPALPSTGSPNPSPRRRRRTMAQGARARSSRSSPWRRWGRCPPPRPARFSPRCQSACRVAAVVPGIWVNPSPPSRPAERSAVHALCASGPPHHTRVFLYVRLSVYRASCACPLPLNGARRHTRSPTDRLPPLPPGYAAAAKRCSPLAHACTRQPRAQAHRAPAKRPPCTWPS